MSSLAPRVRIAVLALACLLFLCAACRRSPQPLPPSPGETITGRERIGWDQPAESVAALGGFQYAMYVNGTRTMLAGVTCDPTPRPEGFGCSAPLPAMLPGPHVLELASVAASAGSVAESARSAPLHVTVAATAPAATAGAVEPVTTADGVRAVAEVVLDGLTAPVDFAQAADGRFFIAERTGRVIVARPPAPASRPP
jgi:hypothetical protein